jgi:predicted RNase H-like HicB family nuclease
MTTYFAVIYPRSDGWHFSVRYPDFDIHGQDIERDDADDTDKVIQLLQTELQEVINKYKTENKPIPLPTFSKHDSLEYFKGDCEYFPVAVDL